MSRSVLACLGAAVLLAALAVIGQRIGLALTLTLLVMIAAGALLARPRGAGRAALALAVALALQPVLRDAGWVVAACVIGALVATGCAVVRPRTWLGVVRGVLAPVSWVGGSVVLGRAVRQGVPRPATPEAGHALLRGVGITVPLLILFGTLFLTADQAFADLTGDLLRAPADPIDVLARLGAAFLVTLVIGGLAWAARPRGATGSLAMAWMPGRVELRIALTALVALFAVFVAVQVRVLFGGATYVQQTTGLGYGDYARRGFVQLLVVALLTLTVVAFAARRRDPRVRLLLAALCALTGVVLASAFSRLALVIDAYGLTRVRYAGVAVLVWLALMVLGVLVAGARPELARFAPRAAMLGTLLLLLGFAVSDPDARIADAAVHGGPVDRAYLATLSADALGALEKLPERDRRAVVPALRERLERPDGWAGFNLSRTTAR